MAPFLSHLVVGERVWPALTGRALDRSDPDVGERLTTTGQPPGKNGYGSFLFGCLAADVDKFCDGLEQKTTHMLAKDPAGTYVWQRSQQFLERQADLLRAPFHALEFHEQQFVMGYLCHLATDEITARRAGAMNRELVAAGGSLPNIDALLTVLDARIWAAASDPARITAALADAPIPDGTLVFAPQECLVAMLHIILPQVRGGGGLEPYLNMVHSQWQWLRYGNRSTSDRDLADLEVDLQTYRRGITTDMAAAEQWIREFEVEPYVKEAASHSLQRIQVLQGKERIS